MNVKSPNKLDLPRTAKSSFFDALLAYSESGFRSVVARNKKDAKALFGE